MLRRLLGASVLLAITSASLWSATTQSAADIPRDPAAPGYLALEKRHPDGRDGPEEFDRAFTSEQALQRLEQTRGFLTSFSLLTHKVRGQLSQAELQEIGNTGLEIQTIGFHNIPLIVEGTLLKQEYQLAQLRYELARARHGQQQITDEDLLQAGLAYAAATKRFQVFWDTRRPTD